MKQFKLLCRLFYVGLLLLPTALSTRRIGQRRKDFPTLFYPGANNQFVTLAPHEIPTSTVTSINTNNHIIDDVENHQNVENNFQMQSDVINENNFDENSQNQVQVVYIRPGSDQSSSLFDVVQGFQDNPLESQESQFRNNGRRPHHSLAGNSPKALRPYPLRLRLQDLVSPPEQSQVEPTIQFENGQNQVQRPQFNDNTFVEPGMIIEHQQNNFQPEEMIVPPEFQTNPVEFQQENQHEFNLQNNNNNNQQFFQQNQQFEQNEQFVEQQANQNEQFSPVIAQNENFFPPESSQQFPQQFAPTPPPQLPRLPWNIPQRRPHALDIVGNEQQFTPDFTFDQQNLPQHPQQFIETENVQFAENNNFNQNINAATSSPSSNNVNLDSFFKSSKTNFSCKNQQFPGYYADIEDGCRTFHVCYGNNHYSFECPAGTLFDQKYLVCNWPHDVSCNSSPDFYHINSIFVEN